MFSFCTCIQSQVKYVQFNACEDHKMCVCRLCVHALLVILIPSVKNTKRSKIKAYVHFVELNLALVTFTKFVFPFLIKFFLSLTHLWCLFLFHLYLPDLDLSNVSGHWANVKHLSYFIVLASVN